MTKLQRLLNKQPKRPKQKITIPFIATFILVVVTMKGIDISNEIQHKINRERQLRLEATAESIREVSGINESVVTAEEAMVSVIERKKEQERLEVERLAKEKAEKKTKSKQTQVAKSYSKEQNKAILRAAAKRYGISESLILRIAQCESSFNNRAFNGKNRNGTWDAGLGQFNSIHGYSKTQLFDPYFNADMMANWLKVKGTHPWNASKHCWNKYN